MVPDTVLGLVLLLTAGAPGFAYVASVEKKAPRRARSSLRELTEVLFIGASASGMTVLLLVASVSAVYEFDAQQLQAFAEEPFVYLVSDPTTALFAVSFVLLTMVIASGIAWQLGRLRYPRFSGED